MCGIPHERQLIILHALKREEFRANNTTALSNGLCDVT